MPDIRRTNTRYFLEVDHSVTLKKKKRKKRKEKRIMRKLEKNEKKKKVRISNAIQTVIYFF